MIPVYDRHTGLPWQSPLFVAALGASSYTFAEATRDQQMESWLRAHVHAFEHFGGIPVLAVPDNTKTGVTKAHRYDPDRYALWRDVCAEHCGIALSFDDLKADSRRLRPFQTSLAVLFQHAS